MGRNISVEDRVIEARTKKELKVSGPYNKHKTGTVADLPDHAESCLSRRYPRQKNLAWSYHLATMITGHGRVFSILIISDEHTQEYLSIQAAGHITPRSVIDELFSLFMKRGFPKYLFSFNDNDSMAKAICDWLEELGLGNDFVELKKCEEDGCGALLKNKLINDLLQQKHLASLLDVQLWLASWKDGHNLSTTRLRI